MAVAAKPPIGGKGSSAGVFIRKASAVTGTTPHPGGSHGMESPRPATVLIVDDEDLVRLLGRDILEQGGYRALEAADAATALQCLEDGAEVLVLFTDVNMPGPLDGLDLAKLVNDRWPNVKILVTSGHMRPDRAELPEKGLFLSKPYRAEELLAMLGELTRK